MVVGTSDSVQIDPNVYSEMFKKENPPTPDERYPAIKWNDVKSGPLKGAVGLYTNPKTNREVRIHICNRNESSFSYELTIDGLPVSKTFITVPEAKCYAQDIVDSQ